ncbi:MAG TPA: hypothetical protein VFB34_04800 [Chloroflexota bacterium]|nr:hypothetical protein [Chloroflexota bacterium]
MNIQLKQLEHRLAKGAALLSRMESDGLPSRRYDQMLRQWLQLLAAYEYESEIDEAAAAMLPVAAGS